MRSPSTSRAPRPAISGRAASEAGFTLLALIIAIAVFNIFLGIAVARWSFVNQRDREQELIWRGEQYSRALLCFVQKRGVPPTDLEELLEEHCIRRLYPDPMSSTGEWRILRAEDLGEDFADIVAGMVEGAEANAEEAQAAAEGGEHGRPSSLRERAQSRGAGMRTSSLLERMRSSQAGVEPDAEAGRSRFGSGSGLGSSSRQGSGLGSSLSSMPIGSARAGTSAGSGPGTGPGLGVADQEPAAGIGGEADPEGLGSGRPSLLERTQGRFKSRLAQRNLTGRAGRSSAATSLIMSAILGVATSGSGEAILSYRDGDHYEDWQFTLTGPNQQTAGEELLDAAGLDQGQLPPPPSGAPGMRGGTEERKSRFRRPRLRRGG